MVGDGVDVADRAGDDRIVGIRRAVWSIGVREVRDAEQQLAQAARDLVVLVGQTLLVGPQCPALGLQLLRSSNM